MDLAYAAGRAAGTMTGVLSAANEQAVQMFIDEKIHYLDIMKLNEACCEAHKVGGFGRSGWEESSVWRHPVSVELNLAHGLRTSQFASPARPHSCSAPMVRCVSITPSIGLPSALPPAPRPTWLPAPTWTPLCTTTPGRGAGWRTTSTAAASSPRCWPWPKQC